MTPQLSPLSLNQLTRDLWGQLDPAAIAQLAPLADDQCYRPKFYKAPAGSQEVMDANTYAAFGLKITSGSLIYGFYLPCVPAVVPVNSVPPEFLVQITDSSLTRKLFDDPVSSLFLANYKPTMQSNFLVQAGSFPRLLCAPYPVVGDGVFMIEFWETSGVQQRVELVIGVLEVCPA